MTSQSNYSSALGWVRAYNSRDLDALMLCYDEHAVNV